MPTAMLDAKQGIEAHKEEGALFECCKMEFEERHNAGAADRDGRSHPT